MSTVCRTALCGLLLCLAMPHALAATSTVAVKRDSLQESVLLDGVIEAVRHSTVSARTAGTVLRLPFDVDDAVAAGELIVELDDREQQARLKQAQASLDEARSGLRDAEQRFGRVQTLRERDLSSPQEFDAARNTLASARARVQQAEAAVVEAREQFGYTRVVAPYDGILTERHVEVGESVSPGQPLLSGLSLEQLRVVADLPQRYAEFVRARRQARVTLNDGRTLATGEMTFYPYADRATHTFRLRLALPDPGAGLYPGMLVKLRVPVATREALWIPAAAVFHHSELTAVFVLGDDGRPRLRQIRTGVERDERVEVLAGLAAGERVVKQPQTLFGREQLDIPRQSSANE